MSLFSLSSTRSFVRLLLMTAAMSLPYVTRAQTVAQAPVPATLSPTDQKALEDARALTRNETACKGALDWNETNASFSDIVAHIQTRLGVNAPPIEVRTTSALRATFTLTQAPLGMTLNSLARLASCRVWVFAGGIVVAPEAVLSDEEAAAVKRREGGDLMQSSVITGSSASWSGRNVQNRVALRIIGADVKAHLAAKGQTGPKPLPVPSTSTPPTVQRDTLAAPFELPFGELSPATQDLLQELLDAQVRSFPGSAAKDKPVPRLNPEVVVGFDDTQPHSLRLFVRGTDLPVWQTRWDVSI